METIYNTEQEITETLKKYRFKKEPDQGKGLISYHLKTDRYVYSLTYFQDVKTVMLKKVNKKVWPFRDGEIYLISGMRIETMQDVEFLLERQLEPILKTKS